MKNRPAAFFSFFLCQKELTKQKSYTIIVLKRTIKEGEMYFGDKHKTITSYYELLSSRICDQYGLTQMEYDILMFLHNNPQHNTAAEIVKIRKSTKSHVSTSLKKLKDLLKEYKVKIINSILSLFCWIRQIKLWKQE